MEQSHPAHPGKRESVRHDRVRLQRVMADAGIAARRACEEMIEHGRVEVNGEVVTTMPVFVDPRTDQISVDGKPIARQAARGPRKIYILLHKPERTLTTASDEPEIGRRTVLDLIDHPAKPRLFPVGRLGWDETGLVLLTNDGELANRLAHPRYGMPKTYLAIVKGDIAEGDLARLGKQMFKLERLASRQEGRIKSAHVEMEVVKREPGKTTVRVTMREGKNRYVADVLGQAGFPVRKVAAVSIGPLQLRGLPLGAWRELTREEVQLLRSACKPGASDAKKAGVREPTEQDGEARRPVKAYVPPIHPRVSSSSPRPFSSSRPSSSAARPSEGRPSSRAGGAHQARSPGGSTARPQRGAYRTDSQARPQGGWQERPNSGASRDGSRGRPQGRPQARPQGKPHASPQDRGDGRPPRGGPARSQSRDRGQPQDRSRSGPTAGGHRGGRPAPRGERPTTPSRGRPGGRRHP